MPVRSGKVLRVCFSKHVENTDNDDMICFLKQFAHQDWPEFNSVVQTKLRETISVELIL